MDFFRLVVVIDSDCLERDYNQAVNDNINFFNCASIFLAGCILPVVSLSVVSSRGVVRKTTCGVAAV